MSSTFSLDTGDTMNRSTDCRIVVAIVTGFGLASVILISVAIGLDHRRAEAVLGILSDNRHDLLAIEDAVVAKSDPLTVYRHYFKTRAEIDRIKAIEERLRNKTQTTTLDHCNFTCIPTSPAPAFLAAPAIAGKSTLSSMPVIQSTVAIHHACCTSEKETVEPNEAMNTDGQMRVVVQTDNLKQTFVTESCEQQPTCAGCTCGQPVPFIYDALVYTGSSMTLVTNNVEPNYIELPGCCKCLNI